MLDTADLDQPLSASGSSCGKRGGLQGTGRCDLYLRGEFVYTNQHTLTLSLTCTPKLACNEHKIIAKCNTARFYTVNCVCMYVCAFQTHVVQHQPEDIIIAQNAFAILFTKNLLPTDQEKQVHPNRPFCRRTSARHTTQSQSSSSDDTHTLPSAMSPSAGRPRVCSWAPDCSTEHELRELIGTTEPMTTLRSLDRPVLLQLLTWTWCSPACPLETARTLPVTSTAE
jgi:hypothetical protein